MPTSHKRLLPDPLGSFTFHYVPKVAARLGAKVPISFEVAHGNATRADRVPRLSLRPVLPDMRPVRPEVFARQLSGGPCLTSEVRWPTPVFCAPLW